LYLFSFSFSLPRRFGIPDAFWLCVVRDKMNRGRNTMKFQNMIRAQLVLAGFAAALLFAGSAKAQEIENAAFYDGPNVVALEQAAPAQPTLVQNSEQAAPAAVQSDATDTTTLEDSLVGGDSLVQDPTEGAWLSTTILISMALVALVALAQTKRPERNIRPRRRAYAAPRTA
jgi:hypothetical protein